MTTTCARWIVGAALIAAVAWGRGDASGQASAQDRPAGPAKPAQPAAAPGTKPTEPVDPYQAALDRALGVEGQLVDALAKVRPSSVSVLNKQPRRDGEAPVLAGVGSGVLVSWKSKTWIVTNDHVIEGAKELEVVTFDGKTWPVELVDVVKVYDIALLRFTGKPTGMKPVQIVPRASKELEEGQWVLATGNPFFLALDGAPVSTMGVISGLDRVLGSGHVYAGAIQHDAAVNPGNSGGPLWNLKGELVGINGMIASRGGGGVGASNTGASFSIPIDQIQPYLDKLVDAKQDAQAGYLGVDGDTATDARGTPNGVRVTQIARDSPAAGADGIRSGDLIVSITTGGRTIPILTSADLAGALTTLPAGTQVRVRVRRAGRDVTWAGKLGARG